MDRREAMKVAGGAFAAAGLGMSGLSEGMKARGPQIVDVGPYKGLTTELKWPDDPPPYDPVAVLDAMRERAMFPRICQHWSEPGWTAQITPPGPLDENGFNLNTLESPCFPDFASAVRWLHQQAAAADPTFAEKWPVPE